MILFFLCPRESPSIPGKKTFIAGDTRGQKTKSMEIKKHHPSHGGTPRKHPFVPGKSMVLSGSMAIQLFDRSIQIQAIS